MPKESVAATKMKLEELLLSVEAHAEEFPFLAELRTELRRKLALINLLQSRQVRLEALKQRTTRELQEAKEDGKDIAARLRDGLRIYLGNKNERLAAFGVKPWRKRTRRKDSGEKVAAHPGSPAASRQPRRARGRRRGKGNSSSGMVGPSLPHQEGRSGDEE